MQTGNPIRPRTVKLIGKLLRPFIEESIILNTESQEILKQLRYLSEHNKPYPLEKPRLIDRTEAASMLGLGLSNFKKLEKENAFPFKSRKIGNSIKYFNMNILEFIINGENQ